MILHLGIHIDGRVPLETVLIETRLNTAFTKQQLKLGIKSFSTSRRIYYPKEVSHCYNSCSYVLHILPHLQLPMIRGTTSKNFGLPGEVTNINVYRYVHMPS